MTTEQRRLAAIVSADVAGYSRLMGRDESGTLAALKALRQEVVDPAIASHGGRIVKTTGDGLLLEFPSVVNAVRCAVEVQSAMADRTAAIADDRRIAFRVGINIGDIIVDGDDIFGDGVNVAARLQEIAAPGGICISSRVHEDVRDRLDTAFDDGGVQTLKNIARPVQVWRWQPSTAASPMPTPLPLPDKPSIAVLPFQNMSGDAEQEYFVDGIAEDITTALSRFRELFVIARNSSFTYKGRAVDVKQVGRELGVRYVLEGSSRKAGNRVRVTAQLIDCLSGSHIWAERYDRELVDIFAVQEEITRSIVSRIAPAIEASVVARARRLSPANLGAHDLAMRSMFEADAAYASADPAMRDRARVSARRALDLDPDCVLAWLTQAWLCWQSAFYSQKERTVEMCQPGLDATRRAIELDPLEHRAYMLRGALYLELRQYDDALADLRHACELNPSDARGLQALGYAELMNGDAKLAKEHGLESLRLNPQDPMRHNTTSFLANACFVGEEYPEGLQWVAESRRSHPDFRPTTISAIKLHVGLGQLDRARAEAERIRSPMFEERVRKGFSMLRQPEHRERELRFFRIALGLPEPKSATETSPTLPLPDKPSIAVLPFQNMSGDPEQEYFVDGIVDDIITELSRFRSLFVIARNSTFTYKGKPVDVRAVARDLGVRYVVEGGIRKAGNRVRVTAQLIDASTGHHLWAERYDRKLEDIFAVQEELTTRIVGAIAPEIKISEELSAARRTPENLTAYEIALRAHAHLFEAYEKTDRAMYQRAIAEGEEALRIDSNSALALWSVAYAKAVAAFTGVADDPQAFFREAEAAANRLVELDVASASGYAMRAMCVSLTRQHERYPDALADARRAHELNPNDIVALYVLGQVENWLGHADTARAHAHQVLRLSPLDRRIHLTYVLLANACFVGRRYEEGANWALRAQMDAGQLFLAHLNAITCFVGMGEIGRAKAEFDKARALAPAWLEVLVQGLSPYARKIDRDRQTTFLRIAAGLEDPSAAEAVR